MQNLDPQSRDVINRLFDQGIAQMLQVFGFRQDSMGGSQPLGDWLYQLCATANAGGIVPTSSSSSISVPVSDSDTPVLAASSTRLGWSIRNGGSKDVYLARGTSASTSSAIVLAPGDRHDDAAYWQGPIHAICAVGESSTLYVEVLS